MKNKTVSSREEFNQKIFAVVVDYVHDDLFKTDGVLKSIDELYSWHLSEMRKMLERVKVTKVSNTATGKDIAWIVNKQIKTLLKEIE